MVLRDDNRCLGFWRSRRSESKRLQMTEKFHLYRCDTICSCFENFAEPTFYSDFPCCLGAVADGRVSG